MVGILLPKGMLGAQQQQPVLGAGSPQPMLGGWQPGTTPQWVPDWLRNLSTANTAQTQATQQNLAALPPRYAMTPQDINTAMSLGMTGGATNDPSAMAVFRGEAPGVSPEGLKWWTPDKAAAKEYGERAVFASHDPQLPEDVYSLDELNQSHIRDIAKEEGIDLSKYNLAESRFRLDNPLDLRELGTDVGDVGETWDHLHGRGLLPEKWTDIDEYGQQELQDQYNDKQLWHLLENEGVIPAAQKQGYDGMIIKDTSPSGRPHDSYALFEGSSVASHPIMGR